jgi:hypothetical protein
MGHGSAGKEPLQLVAPHYTSERKVPAITVWARRSVAFGRLTYLLSAAGIF